jgi:hypothetical protein
MNVNLIRALTVAGLLATSVAAHASPLVYFFKMFW